MTSLRVGIIGANPDAGWAARSHLPALRALPEYELVAVATTRAETAKRAAEIFGAERAFSDATELVHQPDLDLIVVAVNVPQHAALVSSAFEAGKDVLCEWPLGRSTQEAEQLADLARRSRRRGWVMLQGRCSPALIEVGRLIGANYVGRVTSVVVHSTTGLWGGPEAEPGARYQLDAACGADLLAITGGHVVDSVCAAVDQLMWVSTHSSIQHRTVHIAGSDEFVTPDVPDHLSVVGEFAGGAVFAMHLHNGQPRGAATWMQVVGTDGALTLHAPEVPPPGLHRSQLVLHRSRDDGDDGTGVPASAEDELGLDEPALNVARYYRELARHLASGEDSSKLAGFDRAVALHRILDAIRAAETPRTQLHVAGP